ncbi:MAG: lysophospholipid acyltransferase family protein [Myxococcaceae bacterium]
MARAKTTNIRQGWQWVSPDARQLSFDTDGPSAGGTSQKRRPAFKRVRPTSPSAPQATPKETTSAKQTAANPSGVQIPWAQLREALRVGLSLPNALNQLRGALSSGAAPDVDAYGHDAALRTKLAPALDFFYSRYFRVTPRHVERPPQGPALLVANHAGILPIDGLILTETLRRERPDLSGARWLLEDEIFSLPFVGTFFNRMGAVRAHRDNAKRLLEEGRCVSVFPEGVRALTKKAFRQNTLTGFGSGGFVKLALRCRVPIVPVAISGSAEAFPLMATLPGRLLGLPFVPWLPLGPLPFPARWSVAFGEPLATTEMPVSDADDPTRVRALLEQTVSQIDTLAHELRAAR